MSCSIGSFIDWLRSLFIKKYKIKYKLRSPDHAYFCTFLTTDANLENPSVFPSFFEKLRETAYDDIDEVELQDLLHNEFAFNKNVYYF